MTKIQGGAFNSVRKVLGCGAIAVFIGMAPLEAQTPTLFGSNPFGNERGGFHLYSVTGFAGWESVVNPQDSIVLPTTTNLQGDGSLGGGASVGWSRTNKQTTMSIGYSGSYIRQLRYSSLSAFNQSLGLSATRHLGAKWSWGFSATAAVSTYNQMLFSPTVFSSLTAASATPEELASGVLTGQSSNAQVTSLLGGAPGMESPARTLFFGNRVFTSSVSTSLSYAQSKRLSYSLSASGSRAQHLSETSQQADAPQYLYLIPVAVEASAAAGISYSLSPRTTIGLNMGSERGFSRFSQSYTTTGTVSVSRTLSRRWFAQGHAGGGFVSPLHGQTSGTLGTSPVFGGSLGFKAYAHSFLAASDRTLGQSYGLGAADMIITSVAWHWWQPGRSWGLNSGYVQERFRGGGFGLANGWRAMLGMTRQLGRHMMMETTYSYGSYTSKSAVTPYDSAQHAVRVSFAWMPQTSERR